MFAENIQHSPPDEFWMWAAIAVAIAIAGFIAAFVYFHRARIIEDTPTSQLRSAAQGYVELEGKVRALGDQLLQAPLSERPCLWYAYKMEKYVGGKHSRWDTIEKGSSDTWFVFEDATGSCLVNPKGAKVTPSYHGVWTGLSRQPDPRSAPLASTGPFDVHTVRVGSYRYTEKRLDEGDDLYAIGMFKTVSDATQLESFNLDLRATLARLKDNKQALLKHFDKDKNGSIDPQEWERARQAVVDQVKKRHQSASGRKAVDTLSNPGVARRPFLLSAAPQFDLAVRYKRYSLGSLAAFFTAGSVAFYMISQRLGLG